MKIDKYKNKPLRKYYDSLVKSKTQISWIKVLLSAIVITWLVVAYLILNKLTLTNHEVMIPHILIGTVIAFLMMHGMEKLFGFEK